MTEQAAPALCTPSAARAVEVDSVRLDALRRRLTQLRERARRVLLLDGLGRLSALTGLALVVFCLLDRWWVLSGGARLLFLAGVLVGLGSVGLGLAWRVRRETNDDLLLARRIEKCFPDFGERLISAVQFLQEPESSRRTGSPRLRGRLLAAVCRRAEELDLELVVDASRLRRSLRLALLTGFTLATLLAASPARTADSLGRLALPMAESDDDRLEGLVSLAPVRRLSPTGSVGGSPDGDGVRPIVVLDRPQPPYDFVALQPNGTLRVQVVAESPQYGLGSLYFFYQRQSDPRKPAARVSEFASRLLAEQAGAIATLGSPLARLDPVVHAHPLQLGAALVDVNTLWTGARLCAGLAVPGPALAFPPDALPTQAPRWFHSAAWPLATLGVSEGDTLVLHAAVVDRHPRRPNWSWSRPLEIRVVSRMEVDRLVVQQLGQVERRLDVLRQEQKRMLELLDDLQPAAACPEVGILLGSVGAVEATGVAGRCQLAAWRRRELTRRWTEAQPRQRQLARWLDDGSLVGDLERILTLLDDNQVERLGMRSRLERLALELSRLHGSAATIGNVLPGEPTAPVDWQRVQQTRRLLTDLEASLLALADEMRKADRLDQAHRDLDNLIERQRRLILETRRRSLDSQAGNQAAPSQPQHVQAELAVLAEAAGFEHSEPSPPRGVPGVGSWMRKAEAELAAGRDHRALDAMEQAVAGLEALRAAAQAAERQQAWAALEQQCQLGEALTPLLAISQSLSHALARGRLELEPTAGVCRNLQRGIDQSIQDLAAHGHGDAVLALRRAREQCERLVSALDAPDSPVVSESLTLLDAELRQAEAAFAFAFRERQRAWARVELDRLLSRLRMSRRDQLHLGEETRLWRERLGTEGRWTRRLAGAVGQLAVEQANIASQAAGPSTELRDYAFDLLEICASVHEVQAWRRAIQLQWEVERARARLTAAAARLRQLEHLAAAGLRGQESAALEESLLAVEELFAVQSAVLGHLDRIVRDLEECRQQLPAAPPNRSLLAGARGSSGGPRWPGAGVEPFVTSGFAQPKQPWGHLPPRLRQELEQYARDQFVPKYRDELGEYFRAISEKRRAPGD